MGTEKSWNDIFPSTSNPQNDFIPKKIMPNQMQENPELMREYLKKNLFEKIKDFAFAIKKTPKNMRKGLEEGLFLLKKMASNDLDFLLSIQSSAQQFMLNGYNTSLTLLIEDKVIIPLDTIMKKQAQKLRKHHCRIILTSREEVFRKCTEVFYLTLVNLIKEGEYKVVEEVILSNHLKIPLHKAKKLFSVAQQAALMSPEGSEHFLRLLNLRLFSDNHQNPQKIDYSSLQNDRLLKNQIKIVGNNKDYVFLKDLLRVATMVSNDVNDATLRAELDRLIIPEIESILSMAEKELASKIKERKKSP